MCPLLGGQFRLRQQEVQANLAYRWYLGYGFDEQLPDHSVLTKARYRFPEAIFWRFFKHIVLLCRRAGLIDGKYHFIDSTVVKADAAKESFRTRLVSVQEYIKRVKGNEAQEYAFDGTINPEKMDAVGLCLPSEELELPLTI